MRPHGTNCVHVSADGNRSRQNESPRGSSVTISAGRFLSKSRSAAAFVAFNWANRPSALDVQEENSPDTGRYARPLVASSRETQRPANGIASPPAPAEAGVERVLRHSATSHPDRCLAFVRSARALRPTRLPTYIDCRRPQDTRRLRMARRRGNSR